eukprot:12123194-Prorocentrum_lima.AAC.1
MSVVLARGRSAGTERRMLQIEADGHNSWAHYIRMDKSWFHCPFDEGHVAQLFPPSGRGSPWSGGEIAVGGRQFSRVYPVPVVA